MVVEGVCCDEGFDNYDGELLLLRLGQGLTRMVLEGTSERKLYGTTNLS